MSEDFTRWEAMARHEEDPPAPSEPASEPMFPFEAPSIDLPRYSTGEPWEVGDLVSVSGRIGLYTIAWLHRNHVGVWVTLVPHLRPGQSEQVFYRTHGNSAFADSPWSFSTLSLVSKSQNRSRSSIIDDFTMRPNNARDKRTSRITGFFLGVFVVIAVLFLTPFIVEPRNSPLQEPVQADRGPGNWKVLPDGEKVWRPVFTEQQLRESDRAFENNSVLSLPKKPAKKKSQVTIILPEGVALQDLLENGYEPRQNQD